MSSLLNFKSLLLRQSYCAKFRTLQRAQAVSNYFGMIVNWPPIKMQITKRLYEQALRGALAAGREKEGELGTTFLEYLICIEKVDAKCSLAEMT